MRVRRFAFDLPYIELLWCVSRPNIETATVLVLLTSSVAPRSAPLRISRHIVNFY